MTTADVQTELARLREEVALIDQRQQNREVRWRTIAAASAALAVFFALVGVAMLAADLWLDLADAAPATHTFLRSLFYQLIATSIPLTLLASALRR